ncbi:copper type II ascorbate-dependent monooxygenase-like protein [Humibacillus xanthopallidus]|uniref:Copper type II ascorbate-dependent monooxygenase-like protein n=1 Tax=Humibacillus xanthopallidus TaxID=412689 RepID=A0A543PP97_9MICO|nr:hypothetical protein [Humibacillus xanthopallidus]TQN45904.1 copper type II ascorbate-dependent monooxygenase-like protein [Humibacillus xanthopallidus]
MTTRRRLAPFGAALAVAALLAAGCGSPNLAAQSRLDGHAGATHGATGHPTSAGDPSGHASGLSSGQASGAGQSGASGHGASSTPKAAPAALRPGESLRSVAVPAPYTPKAPSGGTDDYRCFVLDPKIARDSFVTGFDIAPGQPAEVHHVILYRVPPSQAAAARQRDAETPGDGWTCFGGTGLGSQGSMLDDAPWVGAWAPGGTERLLDPDIGIPLPKGSLLVLQVHYNLLHGATPDRTAVDLRISTKALTPLDTMLLPAPVELPCRAGHSGPLCNRDAAVLDVSARFGANAGRMVAGLLLLCDGTFTPTPGATQSCSRTVQQPATVRTVAGHMHRLGSSIRIDLNPGTPKARTLLDTKVWDFDNQGAVSIPATAIKPGDRLQVTCTHDQAWRDKLPELRGIPERYVVWGEGTTDEMCLGILGVTRP